MIEKKVASILFNRDRTDNCSNTDDHVEIEQPATETVTETPSSIGQKPISSSDIVYTLSDVSQIAIKKAKELVSKGKRTFFKH